MKKHNMYTIKAESVNFLRNKNIISEKEKDLKIGFNDGSSELLTNIKADFANELKKDEKIIYDFFIWFRENGEKHLGKSIEKLIQIYLQEKE